MSGFGPLASYPLGATPTSVVSAAVAEAMDFATSNEATAINVLLDGIDAVGAPSAEIIQVLLERLRLTGTPSPMGTYYVGLDDSVQFADALAVVWRVLAEEGLDFIGAAAGSTDRIATIIDTLHATGMVSVHKDAQVAVASVLAINSMIATGWKMDAIDTVGFQDALAGALRAVAAVLDGVGFADTPAPQLRITAVVNEAFDLDGDVLGRLEMVERLSEEVLFYTTIRLGDDEYVGWALNEGAPSQYDNYPFNGFVRAGGRYFGTSRHGLYELTGDTDDGEPIEARIKTALMDYGTGVLKRVPDVYLALRGGDQVLLKVITTGQRGEQVETIYTATVPAGDALHTVPVRLGQGLKSRYWQFELTTTDGDDLELDEVSFIPLFLDRRV